MFQDKLLIPVKKFRSQAGRFRWPELCVLASARKADELALQQLAGELKRQLRTRTRIVFDAASPAAVRIVRDHKIAEPEGYKLTVMRDGVIISAATDAGAYYGIQTLREMVRIGGAWMAPGCRTGGPPHRRWDGRVGGVCVIILLLCVTTCSTCETLAPVTARRTA